MAQAFNDLGAVAAQKPRKLVFGQRVRHRGHRAQHGGGVGAERNCQRERLARMGEAVVAEIERAAAMREPAHDDFVLRDDLLTVDPEVLAPLLRPARHHQAPRNKRRDVARPTRLNRQLAKIHLAGFAYDFLAGRAGHYPPAPC